MIGVISTPAPSAVPTASITTTIAATAPKSTSPTSSSTAGILLVITSNVYSFRVYLQSPAKEFRSIKFASVLNRFISLWSIKKRHRELEATVKSHMSLWLLKSVLASAFCISFFFVQFTDRNT